MGRKKIKIKTIENERQKNVTFSRRRCGLIKKAHELAVLCECKVVLMMFDAKDACHMYSSVDDPEGLIEKYYRKEFKTVDTRRRKSVPSTSSSFTNVPAIINEYKISTNGEGSENIQVKHSKNEHNPGAMLLSLNHCDEMTYHEEYSESNCSNYELSDYLLNNGGASEQSEEFDQGVDYSTMMSFQASQPPPINPRLSRHYSYPTLNSQMYYGYPQLGNNSSMPELEQPSTVMSMPISMPISNGWTKRQNSFQY